MIAAVSRIAQWSREQLEDSLLPREGNTAYKVALYGYQFFKFIIFSVVTPLTGTLSFALSPFAAKVIDHPLVAFAKHPQWNEHPEETPAPPIKIGCATADFHDQGPDSDQERFGQLYLKDHPERFNREWHFPDIRHHPERWLDPHKDLHLNTTRISVPRHLVEPQPGQFNEVELERIAAQCRELVDNGIEVVVTLDHFNCPLYQDLTTEAGRQSFADYAVKVMSVLYPAGVKTVVSFNEVGVDPFQTDIMGEWPPYHKVDFEGAAKRVENTLLTHTKVYHALKDRYADLSVGLSHDPIRFRHWHKINPLFSPLERISGEYLTRVNHDIIMDCLQTGKAHFKVPFRANYKINLPEVPPLDFIGLQYYTDPLMYIGICGGDSVTRVKGEKTTTYRYRQYPQGLASALWELNKLGKPIRMTEAGIDTGINLNPERTTSAAENPTPLDIAYAIRADWERILLFGKIFQVVQLALDHGIDIPSIHWWTLHDDFDWHQSWIPKFGLRSFNPETGEFRERGLYHWMKEKLAHRNQQQEVGT